MQTVPSGIAVYAKNTWAAIEGRKALKVKWNPDGYHGSTEEMFGEYYRRSFQPGNVVKSKGDADGAFEGATKEDTITTEFRFPFLAHAPMEPLNCTIQLSDTGAEIWSGSQLQTIDTLMAARVRGLIPDNFDIQKLFQGLKDDTEKESFWDRFMDVLGLKDKIKTVLSHLKGEDIKIHTLPAGGSFGRRGTPAADLIVEACHVAMATTDRSPIQLVWTREDDIRGGFYRPMVFHRVQARITTEGDIAGWEHHLVSKSIFTNATSIGPIDALIKLNYVKTRFDESTVEGVTDTRYAIKNFKVVQHDVTETEMGVPVTWWRSVGHSHTAFAMETVIDELAALASKDPLKFRLHLLADERDRAVLSALNTDWSAWKKADGRGHGIAFHYSFKTRVAMIAEVTLGDPEKGKVVKVDRIVAAVDVGTAVNPDIVRAQVEGAVGFALSSVLRNQITLRDGVVKQSNFDDYEPTRMREMPQVEVHIIESPQNEPPRPPTGIGEPPVPVLAPAIGNAIADALKSWNRERDDLHTLPLNYTTPLPEA